MRKIQKEEEEDKRWISEENRRASLYYLILE